MKHTSKIFHGDFFLLKLIVIAGGALLLVMGSLEVVIQDCLRLF